MGFELTPAFWSGLAQIILVNIILSGDNALVIALACRNQRHPAVVGDEYEIQRCIIDKVLVSGDAPEITAGNEIEAMRIGMVEIGTLRKGHVDVDLLCIEGRRRSSMTVGPVHAKGSPQEIRQDLRRQLGFCKLAR